MDYKSGDIIEIVLREGYSSDRETIGHYSLTRKQKLPCIRFFEDTEKKVYSFIDK